jgi:hypothetical protein
MPYTRRGRSDSFLDSYVDVATRIDRFYAKYPNGRIETEMLHYELEFIRSVTEDGEEIYRPRGYVAFQARCYRSSTDSAPAGVGHSQMLIPGPSSFSRGAEMENAETSAVGRAIAMAGFEVKDGVASREEVRKNRSDDESSEDIHVEISPSTIPNVSRGGRANHATKAQIDEVARLAAANGFDAAKMANWIEHMFEGVDVDLSVAGFEGAAVRGALETLDHVQIATLIAALRAELGSDAAEETTADLRS